MHIAVIADVLGEENNGTSITVKRLITNLKKRGHEVLVVAPGNPDEKDYYPVDKIDFKIFNDYVAKNGVVLAKPNEALLRSVIEKSDVVHALMPFPLGRSAVRICNEMHKPLTTAFHVQPENVSSHFGLQKSKPVNSYIYKNFFNGFYRFSDYIHCPTEFIADQLRRHGYTQDLRIISNGVDPAFVPGNAPKPDEYADKFCILSTGRLVKEKCQSELLKAAALSKYADKLQIFLAGDGPQEKRLLKLGSKLPNPPVISFMKKEELIRTIHFCDLYVHCAYAEIESIACVEAITCGLVPIIADSKKSAAKYFARNESNLYRAANPEDLARKIDYMIEHPEVRQTQREQYIRYAEKFQIDKCIDKMEEMFEDAVAGRHKKQIV